MKTKHVQELRKGVREARNLKWLSDYGMPQEFMRLAYQAAIKRSTYVSFKAFKRTLRGREW